MRLSAWLLFPLLLSASSGDDPGCPAYPTAVRAEWEHALEADQAYAAFAKLAARRPNSAKDRAAEAYKRDSFIDHLSLDKMARDGVVPAAVGSDEEFLRRVTIDLTGRIPQPKEVEDFLSDSSADKRSKAIARLINSPAFVDQFTLFFSNKFKVTRGGMSSISS